MKKTFLFVAAMTAMLTGCSQDDSVQNLKTNSDTALGISSASMSASVTTKGTQTTLASGSIGVYRTVDAGSGYTAQLSEYAWNATDSKWGSANLIYLNNNNAQICAFYPYIYVDPASFDPTAVALTAQKYDAAKDFVYVVNAPFSNTNRTADFQMSHAYSKVTFTINKDVTYTGIGAISSLSLSNDALVQSNTINITSAAYGAGTVAAVTYNPAISSMTTGTAVTSELLLPPTITDSDMSGNVALTVIVDGISLSVNIPASNFSSKFVAGNNYQVALTIKGTSLIVNSVKIADWTNTVVAGNWVPSI